MTVHKARFVVEDHLITNGIEMVKKLKAQGRMEEAAQMEAALKARRNANLLQMFAA